MVSLTDFSQLVVIGYPAIKVNGHHASGLGSDVLFYLVDIKFEMLKGGFYKDRNQMVVSDGKDGRDIGVGRNDDLIAVLHDTHFLIAPEDEPQRIQSIGYGNSMLRSDIMGIV